MEKLYIDTIAVDDNSIELHNRLKELGYVPLKRTTSSGRSNCYTVLTNYYPYDKDLRRSFWNVGGSIKNIKNDCILVCNSVEEFLEKSELLLKYDCIIVEK